MKNHEIHPAFRFATTGLKFVPYNNHATKCGVSEISNISSEIILRKRISLALLLAFLPFMTVLYLIASTIDVNKAYFVAFAFIYGTYYLVYSMWACSSSCPVCGQTMSRKYLFIMPSLSCSHCGHDLKRSAAKA